ncbi:hypothetical protein B0T11DRAFT_345831, partial [Plectosphaerella cucumerina]
LTLRVGRLLSGRGGADWSPVWSEETNPASRSWMDGWLDGETGLRREAIRPTRATRGAGAGACLCHGMLGSYTTMCLLQTYLYDVCPGQKYQSQTTMAGSSETLGHQSLATSGLNTRIGDTVMRGSGTRAEQERGRWEDWKVRGHWSKSKRVGWLGPRMARHTGTSPGSKVQSSLAASEPRLDGVGNPRAGFAGQGWQASKVHHCATSQHSSRAPALVLSPKPPPAYRQTSALDLLKAHLTSLGLA